MAKLDIQPLDIQPLDIQPLDIQPIEEPTSIWEDVKISAAGAANTYDRFESGLAMALANLVGNDEIGEKEYKKLQERIKARTEAANPKKKTQRFQDKAIGMGLTLPLQLLAFPFSPADTGQTMLDQGESLGTAVGGAAIDTAGNMLGVAAPGSLGTTLLGKGASGAVINAAQDALTRLGISGIAEKQSTKDIFNPTWETTGLAALLGGPLGMISPTTKKSGDVTPVNDRLKAKKPAEVLDTSYKRYQHGVKQENTDAQQVAVLEKFLKEYEAQKVIDERQTALEQDVARQQSLDFNAAERARREAAPTGYDAWVEAQRQDIGGDPGVNDPINWPRRVADRYPDVTTSPMEARPDYNPLDPGINAQRALPIEIADMLRTGDQIPDPFNRVSTSQNAARMAAPLEERIRANETSQATPDEVSRFEGEGNSPITPRIDPTIPEFPINTWEGEGGVSTPTPAPIRRGRGPARGGIDPDLLTFGMSKLVERFKQGTSKEWLNSFLDAKLYASKTDPDTVIEAAKAEGAEKAGNVITRPTHYMAAGGTLEGMKRNSALVTGVSRILQRAKNIGEDKQKMNIFPVEGVFRKLKPDGLVKLSKALLEENDTKVRFTETQLLERGFDVDTIIAYNKYRQMMDDVWNYENSIREAQGKKPISREEAYMTSTWEGDFRQPIKDKDGRTVWMIGGNTKRSVKQQTAAVMKQFPDLTPGPVTYSKSTRTGVDAVRAYRELVDLLGEDDPTVQKIKAWADEKVLMEGRGHLGQEKHFERKYGARGYLGDRPVNTFTGKFDAKKEALAQIQASIDYAKNAYAWGEMQLAMADLKKIINNEELLQSQPRNIQFVRDYVLSNLGMNDSAVSKAVDDTLRSAGLTPHSVVKSINDIKGLWVTQKLLGAGHYVANILQAANMIPHLTDIASKYGGNPLTSVLYGTYMGMVTGTSHTLHSAFGKGPQNRVVYQSMKAAGLSDFDLRAVKYAEDNSITTRSIYDESPIETEFTKTGKAKRAATRIIAAPETFLRASAFMTYAKMLESSGKFKNDLDLFRVAEEYVNASMGDYRGSERAMLFDKLGSTATAVNTFTTFPINYFNQWSWAAREMGRKNPGPFVAMFMTQYLLAGAMGVPGFNDMDKIWNWLKDQLKTADPAMWAKVKDVDLKDAAFKVGGNVGLYGAPSTFSDYALTSRVSAPAGLEMTATPVAPWLDMAKIAGNAVGVARSPSDTQKWAELTHSVAPAGLQSFVENTMFRDQMSVPAERDGVKGRIVGKPSDLNDRKGQVFRTPEMEEKRVLGLRSQQEQFEKDFTYRAQKRQQDVREVSRELVNKTYNQIRNGNMDKARDYIKLYAQLTGKPMTSDMFTTRIVNEFTTGKERALMDVTTVEGMIAAKRLKQLLDEQK